MKTISILTNNANLKNNLFNPVSRDNCNSRYILLQKELRKIGLDCGTYDLKKPDDSDLILSLDAEPAHFNKVYAKKILLLVQESPLINQLNNSIFISSKCARILTWDKSKVDKQKVFWLGCGCQAKIKEKYFKTNTKIKNKSICAIISNKRSTSPSELYSERLKAINFFSKSAISIDLYGESWNKRTFIGYFRALNRIPLARKIFYKPPNRFCGTVKNKMKTYSNYQFAICYENARTLSGYITEKIFDAMFSGCIPIYLGAEDIHNFVPADTFIDMRKFCSYAQLEKFLINISQSEIESYKNSIKSFYKTYLKTSFFETEWVQTIIYHCKEVLAK